MALTPPSVKLWWNEPVERTEIIWIAIAFVWGLVMFFTMVLWHVLGDQNLSNEAYRIEPERFEARVEEMVAKHEVGTDSASGLPIVQPPVGSDVYMLGRTFQWYPILKLEKNQSYRLHLSAMDVQHGFSLQPINMNLQVHPGYEMVLTVKPDKAGEFTVVCNEYCGLGHHLMTGKILVVEKK